MDACSWQWTLSRELESLQRHMEFGLFPVCAGGMSSRIVCCRSGLSLFHAIYGRVFGRFGLAALVQSHLQLFCLLRSCSSSAVRKCENKKLWQIGTALPHGYEKVPRGAMENDAGVGGRFQLWVGFQL